jgi:membrane complex biogenesis BtpA family protein
MSTDDFQQTKPVFGVVQLLPLPGSAGWAADLDALRLRAEQEATALATGGVDGLLVENTFDAETRLERLDTAGAVAMALILRRLRQLTGLPIGVSVLPNDPESALALAMLVGASFIRVPVWLGGRISEQGLISSRAAELLAYKETLRVQHLPPIYTDVTLDHLVPGTGARQAGLEGLEVLAIRLEKQGLVSGIILSADECPPDAVTAIRQRCRLPVWVSGSQLEEATVSDYHPVSDGLLLGPSLRKTSPVSTVPTIDPLKVEAVLKRLRQLRGTASAVVSPD